MCGKRIGSCTWAFVHAGVHSSFKLKILFQKNVVFPFYNLHQWKEGRNTFLSFINGLGGGHECHGIGKSTQMKAADEVIREISGSGKEKGAESDS